MLQCRNCNTALEDSFNYCPACSQKVNTHRLSMHDVGHELVHYFTHADKSIFSLVKLLVTKNGRVAKDYINGKRKKYFPPLNFFLLVATVFVLMISISTSITKSAGVQSRQTQTSGGNNSIQFERREKAIDFLNKYSNFLAMFSIPLIAFIYWLFYDKQKYNFTEHLAANMYMSGFTFLVYALLIIPVITFMGIRVGQSLNPALVSGLFQLIYNTVFYTNFTDDGRKRPVKAFVAGFTAILSWFVISGVLVGFYIRFGFPF